MSDAELTIPALVALEIDYRKFIEGEIRPSEYVQAKTRLFDRVFWIHVTEPEDVIDSEITRLAEIGALSASDVQKIHMARGYDAPEPPRNDAPVVEPPVVAPTLELTPTLDRTLIEKQVVSSAREVRPTTLGGLPLRLAIVGGVAALGFWGWTVWESAHSTAEPTDVDEVRAELTSTADPIPNVVAKKEVVAPWNSVVPVSEESEIQTFVEAFCGVENAEKRDKSWYCSCPPGAAEPEDELQFLGAWKGAFSSSDSHEVIVRWDGCGGGFNFSQSTGLLRLREGLNWEKVAHNWDLDTSDCQPAELGDRHYLFCQSATSGQGTSEVDVFGVTLKDDGFEFLGVSSFEDHGGTCSYVGDFSTSLEGRLVEDVNADGRPDLVALVSVKRGAYVGGAEPSEDPCEDENNGRVIFETIHRVFARQVGESDSRVYEKADQVQSPGAKKFLESTPAALPSVDAEIAAFWSLDLGSEEVWPIYERRIAAYRNSGDIELAQREISRISALYPERAENIDLDLAEMCEEFGDYFCASKIYTRLLEAMEISGLTFGRAAWFFCDSASGVSGS